MTGSVRMTEEFLTDHSYIWLVSKAMAQYMGYANMVDFINQNYYIKANLTKNKMVDRVSGVMDMYQYPDDYTGFVYAFAKGLMPGVMIDEINYDFDRNNLLGKFSAKRHFLFKDYSFGNSRENSMQLNLYCHLYKEIDSGDDVFASILVVDIGTLHGKIAIKSARAEFDTLTGLFNSAYGEYRNKEHLLYHPDDSAALLAVRVNDLGRFIEKQESKQAGTVIAQFAARLTEIFDKSCTISRTNVDQFTVFMRNGNVSTANEAIEVLLAEAFVAENDDEQLPYHVSVGYALYPEDSRDYSELSRMAEMALEYLEKVEKPDSYRYNRSMMSTEKHHMGLNMMEIANCIPGALLVSYADAQGQVLYANQDMLRLFECDSLEDFSQWIRGNIREIVYYEDSARVEHRRKEILAENDMDKEYSFRYRITTKKGVLHEVEDSSRIVESQYYGKILYTLLKDLGQ